MFSMMTIILGRTEAEAKAKYADYRSHINPEGALTLMSGWTGVDFSTYDLDQQVRHVQNDAGRTAMDNITRADPDRVWTVREVASMSASAASARWWSARRKRSPTISRPSKTELEPGATTVPFGREPAQS